MFMKNLARISIQYASLLLVTITILGCANVEEREVNEVNVDEHIRKFRNGEIEFNISFTSVNMYSSNRQEMLYLYKAESWDKLALIVIKSSYDKDITYFYLGRSAEAIGYYEAARRYYARSMETIHRCGEDLFHDETCDGFKFPDVVLERINYMNKNKLR